jgi:hypothetical protein
MFKRLGMFDRSLGMFQPAGTVAQGPFTPLSLFAAGEQGAWYDPSDLTSMFQDAAGTTPVTAMEQPVGLLRDKSGRGNHASQTTLAARPVLSARYNLLTYTEQFDNATWGRTGISVTPDTTLAPDGTLSADTITGTLTTNAVIYNNPVITASATNYTASVYVKAGTASFIVLSLWTGSGTNGVNQWYNLQTGAKGNNSVTAGYTFVSSNITALSNGWYRLDLTGSVAAGNLLHSIRIVDSNGTFVYTNVVGKTAIIWGADLRFTNDGVGIPNYQRVAAATNYDSTGFPPYLRFDGVDDCLFTSSINFTATDKMTVWAGERKISDAAQGVVAELSATIASNNGTFLLSAPNSAAANLNYSSKGTVLADNTVTTYAAPITNVITGQSDIAGDSNIIRINGSAKATVSTDQGTGSFGNYPLYVGRRNNTSLQWNGRLYSLIVRGAQSTLTQVTNTETWVNGKTKAY